MVPALRSPPTKNPWETCPPGPHVREKFLHEIPLRAPWLCLRSTPRHREVSRLFERCQCVASPERTIQGEPSKQKARAAAIFAIFLAVASHSSRKHVVRVALGG